LDADVVNGGMGGKLAGSQSVGSGEVGIRAELCAGCGANSKSESGERKEFHGGLRVTMNQRWIINETMPETSVYTNRDKELRKEHRGGNAVVYVVPLRRCGVYPSENDTVYVSRCGVVAS
jgi:hypothetical protein